MNPLDYIIIAVLLFYTFMGLRKGLVRIVFDLVAMIGGLFLARRYGDVMGQYLITSVSVSESYAPVAGFVCVWVMVLIGVWALGWAVHKVLGALMMGPMNALGGGVFGFVKGAVIVMPFILGSMMFETKWAAESVIVRPVGPVLTQVVSRFLPGLADQAGLERFAPFDKQPGEFYDGMEASMQDQVESVITDNPSFRGVQLQDLQEVLNSGDQDKIDKLLKDLQ